MLFASCTSYEPRPLQPGDELEALRAVTIEGLRIEHAAPGVALDSGSVAFELSDGLDEAELIAVALTVNPVLRAKRLEIGEAKALLVSAGLWPNPDLGAVVLQGIGGLPSTGVGLDLLFGILRPDERPARRAVAEARIEATRAEIVAEEYRVAAEARRTRIAVLAAEQVSRQFEQETRLRDQVVDLVRRQRELGDATEVAMALAELDRASIHLQFREARAVYDRERRALNQVLGLSAEYDLRLTGLGQPLVFSLHDDLSDAEVERRVIAGRFDLQAMAAAYRQAEAQLRLAVARQFPSLRVGPSFGRDVGDPPGLGLGAAIELPLFDRNQGEIQNRHAVRERARAEYVASMHGLLARAFEARAALRRAREEVELQRREVLPLIERTETLFEGALRAKAVTVFEWLTARTRVLRARRDLLDALVRHAGAVVELESATGAPITPPAKQPTKIENHEVPR